MGPAGPKVKEPLALLVLIHADPAGQRDAIHRAASVRECLPAQPEPPDGDRSVEVSDCLTGTPHCHVWTHYMCIVKIMMKFRVLYTTVSIYSICYQ